MHTHINISQYYQHSKKIDNIDKTIPVSFSSSCCLNKLILKRLSTLHVCLNMMACYFRSPQRPAAAIPVISPSLHCVSFLSSIKDGAPTNDRGNIFSSFVPNLFEACSRRYFFLLPRTLLGL